ncbi:MAG: MFS transporter [Alphaproteobacteria bacterium]|nr:MFS transporter [Alphaproteobacteria bacterium]
MTRPALSESRLILLMGVIIFTNILDFMMVMPLGPDFARALGIPAERIGIIAGSYTLEAAVTGLVASLFLDRFNRKKALLFSLFGLAIATLLGALAWNTESLLATRLLAGAFGGPLSSLCNSMIADHIPHERRGAAIGKTAGGFAAAAVLGVPFGLNLALHFGWRAPFLAVGAFMLIIFLIGARYLPTHGNIPQHDSTKHRALLILHCFRNRISLSAFGYTALATMTSMMIVPNISAHVQMNLNYPRADLDLLYFFGGIVSFFGMRLVGKIVDKTSAFFASILSSAIFIIAVFLGFIWFGHGVPFVLIMVGFMSASSARNVCGNALSSKIPRPSERGSFMSLISVMMHVGTTAGAFISAQMLTHTDDNKLHGIENVGILSVGLSLLVPVLFYITEKHLKKAS